VSTLPIPASSGFAAFQLQASLQAAIDALGFHSPTPVQEQVIPQALAGKDLLVSSQTGSGKTAAFLIPLLQRLLSSRNSAMRLPSGPSILVLSPTRELAQQVADDAIDLLKGSRGVRVATVVGGLPYGKQLQALRGADLVVATPGRLLDLYRTRKIRLDQVVHVVVDEADRMLDLGFAEDLQAIALASAQREQTLMFSATFAPRIMQLAEKLTKDPIRIAITALNQAKPDISELIHLADHESHRIKLLEHYLSDSSVDQAVIFARTQVECEQLGEKLTAQGLSVTYLHGALPQSVRTRRLNAFREKRVQWLVATDVAARGLDVPSISHVINLGLPMKPEDYVHRIGRTARAGRSGVAVTMVEVSDMRKLRAIERVIERRLENSVIPGLEPKVRPLVRNAGKPSTRPPSRSRPQSFGQSDREFPRTERPAIAKPRSEGWQDRSSVAKPRSEGWQDRSSVAKPRSEGWQDRSSVAKPRSEGWQDRSSVAKPRRLESAETRSQLSRGSGFAGFASKPGSRSDASPRAGQSRWAGKRVNSRA
jgi:superfamily II DNA/RNA helicase